MNRSFFNALVTDTTVNGALGVDSLIFSGEADFVSFDGTFARSIVGAGVDTLVFELAAEVAGTTVRGGAAADSLVFGGNLVTGVFAGGAANDVFSGTITVGAGDVSFGGSGDDSFSFTNIAADGTNAGTAYFWNEAGTDSISFSQAATTLGLAGGVSAVFGIDTDEALHISFVDQTTNIGSCCKQWLQVVPLPAPLLLTASLPLTE